MMLQAEQMHKIKSISLKMVEVVILSENSQLSFCQLLSLKQQLFSSQLEISHVLNWTTSEIQHRK